MLNLVTINPDYTLKINALEVVANVKFNKILTRKNPSPGDPTGDKKLLNTLEMVFVVLYSEKFLQDNTFSILNPDERIAAIRLEIGLGDSWYPDADVKNATNEYIRIQKERNPTLNMLNSLEQGLMTGSKGINAFNRSLEKIIGQLDELNDKAEHSILTKDEAEFVGVANDIIVANIAKIVDIGSKLPKTLAGISDLITAVKKEQGSKRYAKGGVSIGRREDPR